MSTFFTCQMPTLCDQETFLIPSRRTKNKVWNQISNVKEEKWSSLVRQPQIGKSSLELWLSKVVPLPMKTLTRRMASSAAPKKAFIPLPWPACWRVKTVKEWRSKWWRTMEMDDLWDSWFTFVFLIKLLKLKDFYKIIMKQ